MGKSKRLLILNYLVPLFYVATLLYGGCAAHRSMPGLVSVQTEEVKDYCKNLKGRIFWLKIGVVEVKNLFRGVDATNVLPDGEVSYRASINIHQTQSQDPEDFAEEARIILAKKDELGVSAVRVLKKGTKVRIKDVKVNKREVKIELDKTSGSRHAIRLKFKDKYYTLEEFKNQFRIAFAEEESELEGAEKTINIDLGLSIEEVVKIRGKPKSRINLGSKTVITYEDMKLIFKDGKLVDAL